MSKIDWKIFKVAHELMEDRGYVISWAENKHTPASLLDYEVFVQENKMLANRCIHSTSGQQKVLLVFCGEESLSVKAVQKYKDLLFERRIHRGTNKVQQSCEIIIHALGILVVRNPLIGQAKKECQNYIAALSVEIFQHSELMMNITRHELVPQHSLCLNTELSRLRSKITDLNKLPKLKQTDPVAKYYGFRRGEIVRIDRKSYTAGKQ